MKKTFITLVLTVLTASAPRSRHIRQSCLQPALRLQRGRHSPHRHAGDDKKPRQLQARANFSLGLGIYKPLSDKWGLTTGLHLENKGMNIDATVKNYHMAIVRGGQRLEGQFTGHNASEVEMWMLTLPLQATTPLTATCT